MENERLAKLMNLLLYNVADLYYRHYLALSGPARDTKDLRSIHDNHTQALQFTKLSLEPYQELLGTTWDDFWFEFVRNWEAATENLTEIQEQTGFGGM